MNILKQDNVLRPGGFINKYEMPKVHSKIEINLKQKSTSNYCYKYYQQII